MVRKLHFLVGLARAVLKSRRNLLFENLALRHQLLVLTQNTKRPRWNPVDRLLWVCLSTDAVVFENYDAGEICAAKDVGLSGLRDSGLAFSCWMTERCPMQPWQLLLIGVAGWMNRKQQQVIEYLLEENRVLREQIGKKRLSLTDRQRRRLAGKAKVVGSKGLKEFARVATPQALLRWYRNLIAGKYDGSQKRGPGRPRTGE